MKKKLSLLLATASLMAAMALPVSALEYSFDAPEDFLFGRPTSDDTIYVTTDEPANVDRSKNAALIPPAFGSPTSYVLGSGELLTPNLIRDGQSYEGPGNSTSAGSSVTIPNTSVVPSLPSVDTGGAATAYTPVTDALFYSGGHLATLSAPSIGLNVKVYEGTDDATLGAGLGIWGVNNLLEGYGNDNSGANAHVR